MPGHGQQRQIPGHGYQRRFGDTRPMSLQAAVLSGGGTLAAEVDPDEYMNSLESGLKIRLTIWGVLAALSSGASAYHGYKRSRGSVGSAVGWGLLGFIFPVVTPAVALAQGYAKPKR